MASSSKTLESVLAVLSVLAIGQLSACAKKSQATATPQDAASEAGSGEASCSGGDADAAAEEAACGEGTCSGGAPETAAEEACCGEGTCAVASLE